MEFYFESPFTDEVDSEQDTSEFNQKFIVSPKQFSNFNDELMLKSPLIQPEHILFFDSEDHSDDGFSGQKEYSDLENEFYVPDSKGTTDYINVSAVKGKSLKTGIFIPSGYKRSEKTDIILYLHGLYTNGDRSNGIEYYWKYYSNIRDYFYTTKRNAILIAPTLSSNPQNDDVILNQSGGLDKFLSSCLTALLSKNYLPTGSTFSNIIIAAHSAGGKPLAKIVNYPSEFKEKIIECWGFDCLYAEWWANNISLWAKSNKRFYHYWAWSCNAKNLKSCPRVIGDKIRNNPNVQNIAPVGKADHRQVIENAWLYQILNRPWFETIESELMLSNENIENYKKNEDLVFDVSKAIKLNAIYSQSLGWNKYYYEINKLLLPFSGQMNISLGDEAFTRSVASWQHQHGFSPKDSDGIIGPSTWNLMQSFISGRTSTHIQPNSITGSGSATGLTFTKYHLSTSQIVIQKKNNEKKYAEIRRSPSIFLKEIIRNAGEDPEKWYDRFTRITFLGRSLKGDQYVQENFAIHLKKLEKKLAHEFGGVNANPTIAGDILGLTYEGISGSRLISSTADFSYHMFGLAVDINYTGCPFIQAHDAFNAFMRKVVKLVANIAVNGITWGMSIPAAPEKYLKLFDELFILNNYLKKYFSFLEPQNESSLNVALNQCSFSPWNGFDTGQAKALIKKDLSEIANAWKGKRENPEDIFKNGFLNLTRDFVKGMVESGLDWGARYGDIMHFDMRTATGIGSRIENAKNHYISEMRTEARKLYTLSNNEDFFDHSYENVTLEQDVPSGSTTVGGSSTVVKKIDQPSIIIRPGKFVWRGKIFSMNETAQRRYTVDIGCLPKGVSIYYDFEGQAFIRSGTNGEEIPYNAENFKLNFPGKRYLSEIEVLPGRGTPIAFSTRRAGSIDKDGRFVSIGNNIQLDAISQSLTFWVLLSDPKRVIPTPAGSGTSLILNTISIDITGLCEEAEKSINASAYYSNWYMNQAAKLEPLNAKYQINAIKFDRNDLGNINYYLLSVGLRLDGNGFLHMYPGWQAPDYWRWKARNSIWNNREAFSALTISFITERLLFYKNNFIVGRDKPLPFYVFIGELRRFEDLNAGDLTIEEQIRKLRRSCHESSLIFDEVLNVTKGESKEYKNNGIGGDFQFLKDHNRIEVNGREIDMWHLFVGMDALLQDKGPKDKVNLLSLPIQQFTQMERAAAATWAGDIGSALTDWMVRYDEAVENKLNLNTMDSRLDHYWSTRSSTADLDGDILAWGMHEMRIKKRTVRLSDLLLYFFHPSLYKQNRKKSFELFVNHYSLPANPKELDISRVEKQIEEFGKIWNMYRFYRNGKVRVYTDADMQWGLSEMVSRLINYVDSQLI